MGMPAKLKLIVTEWTHDGADYCKKIFLLIEAKARLKRYLRTTYNTIGPELHNENEQTNKNKYTDSQYISLKRHVDELDIYFLIRSARKLGITTANDVYQYFSDSGINRDVSNDIYSQPFFRKQLFEEIMHAREVRRAPLIAWIAIAVSIAAFFRP